MHEEDLYSDQFNQKQEVRKQLQGLNMSVRLTAKEQLLKVFATLSEPSPSQSALSQSHKIIGQYQKLPQILEIFFELIIQLSAKSQTMTKLVITQIFTYMKKQSSFGYDDRHDRMKISRKFLDFFVDSSVQSKFKKMLQNTYMQFIYVGQNIKLRQIVVEYVDNKLTQIFTSTKASQMILEQYNRLSSPIHLMIPSEQITTNYTFKTCLSLIHLLKCLFVGGNLEPELMKVILPNLFSIYYQVTLETLKQIMKAIEMKHEGQFAIKVDQCAKYSELIVLMYSKLDSGKFPELRDRVLHTRELYRLLLVLMNVSPHFQSLSTASTILTSPLYSTGKQPTFQQLSSLLTHQINSLSFEQNFLPLQIPLEPIDPSNKRILFNLVSIKKNSVEILVKCVKILTRKKLKNIGQYPYLCVVLQRLWVKVKECLIIQTERYLKSAQSKTKESQLSIMSRQHQDLLNISIRFLSSCIKLPILYSTVSPYHQQTLFKICMPWLISRKQHQRFQTEDYLFFREDLVNKQNMSYIENSVASLVESYMDNVDGVVSKLMQNCLGLMRFCVTRDARCLEQLAKEVANSWVMEFYPMQRLMQSCLTLIAIQSYLSLQRNDLALTLQQFLCQHQQYFLSLQQDYRITTQFLMMYSYYVDNFYSNLIQGVSSQTFEHRPFHQQVLKFCCYVMKANYNYERNDYRSREGKVLYFVALDCLNNSMNHSELMYVLYCHFPLKQDLVIPHYMLPYDNYPFYPVKKPSLHLNSPSKKPLTQPQLIQPVSSFLRPYERTETHLQQQQQQSRQLVLHYRKLGLNQDQYFQKDQFINIIQFLSDNLLTKPNIKIIEVIIEFLVGLLKEQVNNQGTVVNVPVVVREDVVTLLAIKVYSLIHAKPNQFPNRALFQTKSTQLIYLLHTISTDPYYIYSLGLQIIWLNPDFWRFDPLQDDNNIDKLLKCTDLVVRLALKHYSSEKGIKIHELMLKIVAVFTQHCFQYIQKMHKFNIIFGILLNLILMKIDPEKMFEFLYLMITEKLIKAELKQSDSDNDDDNSSPLKQKASIPSLSASDLLSLSFYLFLCNMQRNPQCLNSQKNFQLLKVFHSYLTHYTNVQQIVTQYGDVFGKIFACCLSVLEREYVRGTLNQFDHHVIEFFWRNVLYSGKIYKTELEMRIVALKLLALVKEVISRNDSQFPLERLELIYQTACSCVFYSRNKELLMMDDEDDGEEDFDHAGEEEEWENLPITLNNNDTSIYLEDDVLLLKIVSRELLESQNLQKKQWVTKLIENLPVAVRNFVKNKVINYEQQTKQIGLRKIIKVKRPEGLGIPSGLTKQEIIKENTKLMKENEQKSDDDEDS